MSRIKVGLAIGFLGATGLGYLWLLYVTKTLMPMAIVAGGLIAFVWSIVTLIEWRDGI